MPLHCARGAVRPSYRVLRPSYRTLRVCLAFPQESVGAGSYNTIWPLRGGHAGLRNLVVRLPTEGYELVHDALRAQRKQLLSSMWLRQPGNGRTAVVGALPVVWFGRRRQVLRDAPSSDYLDIRAALKEGWLQVGLVYQRGKDAAIMTDMLAETVRRWRSTALLTCGKGVSWSTRLMAPAHHGRIVSTERI